MMIALSDKVAVVTGGASGIGRGICLVLAEQGADVAVTDMNLAGSQSVADDVAATGRQSVAIQVDVTDRASIQDMVSQVLQRFGTIDILVNDAGIVGVGEWWERERPSDDDWSQVFAVNVRGVVMVSEAVSEHMIERQSGKIVNIASIAARQGSPDLPHYSTSKAAVASWTQSNAAQLARHNINVNAICPGLLWTPMWQAIARKRSRYGATDSDIEGLSGRELFDQVIEETIPMGREQTPDDVGRLAAFLVSEDARNITGQAINVDGGRRMN